MDDLFQKMMMQKSAGGGGLGLEHLSIGAAITQYIQGNSLAKFDLNGNGLLAKLWVSLAGCIKSVKDMADQSIADMYGQQMSQGQMPLAA